MINCLQMKRFCPDEARRLRKALTPFIEQQSPLHPFDEHEDEVIHSCSLHLILQMATQILDQLVRNYHHHENTKRRSVFGRNCAPFLQQSCTDM